MTNYQILLRGKDPRPLLDKWAGAEAKVWDNTVTHRVLVIRLLRRLEDTCLEIQCGDVTNIQCSTLWSNAQLRLERAGDDWRLFDQNASVQIIAGMVAAQEVAPSWRS